MLSCLTVPRPGSLHSFMEGRGLEFRIDDILTAYYFIFSCTSGTSRPNSQAGITDSRTSCVLRSHFPQSQIVPAFVLLSKYVQQFLVVSIFISILIRRRLHRCNVCERGDPDMIKLGHPPDPWPVYAQWPSACRLNRGSLRAFSSNVCKV